MRDLIRRLILAFFVLGVLILALGLVWQAQGQERKGGEVQMPPKPLSEDALITMDFQDADLSVVIKFMGELTGKNFLVSDQVRGKVTVISPKKITVREAYKIFESVLEMNGYSTVQGEDATKIIPSAAARQSGLEIREGKEIQTGPSEDRMITQVIPLEHASADEVRNLFASSVSKEGMIVSYKPTNHLMITDRASNIQRLLKIIEQIDVRIVEERISVFTLEYASARSLADKLTQLMSADQRQPAAAARPPATPGLPRLVRIIPDERTNMLVVLANQQDTQEIRKLISQLDTLAPRGKSQLHVRYLEHARAEDLAKVLSTIAAAKAKAVARTQTPQAGAAGAAPVEEASITADKSTNSLVITASPQEFQELEEVISKLDTFRSQVLVEALITEVSLEKALQIGVDWRLMDQPAPDSVRGVGGSDFGLISGVQQGTLPSSTGDTGLLLGLAKGVITGGGVTVPNIGLLVRAFQKDTDANVLSTPHILTMDNEKAKIIVADNVPLLKSDVAAPLVSTATTTSVAVSRTFEYKDIGIQLEITPHISKGNIVRLEISTEVSNILSIDPANPGFVTTRKRQATTTVAVESGQIIVIGGLIRDESAETTKKVPCVGNIPILGWMFKNLSGTQTKTNLLIFISPQIVRTAEDMERATAKKKKESEENLQKLRKERENEVKDTFDKLVK
jgi:general secretion pathway protein D